MILIRVDEDEMDDWVYASPMPTVSAEVDPDETNSDEHC